MIWKLLGWLMVIGIVIGAVVSVAVIWGVGMMAPGSRIDWSFVPLRAVIPLAIGDSFVQFAALVIAALPAPIGFFRKARGIQATKPLLIYTVAAALVSLILVASHCWLAMLGRVQVNEHTFRTSGYDNALQMAIVCVVVNSPVAAAIVALRKPRAERRGFEVGTPA